MNNNDKLTYAQALQLQVEFDKRSIVVESQIDEDFGEFTAILTGDLDGKSFVIYCDHTGPILQRENDCRQLVTDEIVPAKIVDQLIAFL